MNCAGFLNLPDWQEKLQKILTDLDRQDLLRSPVLGYESVDNPWVAFDAEDFFAAVETGILFQGAYKAGRFPGKLVTADPETALNRLKAGKYKTTFYNAAIGATFPVLSLFSGKFEVGKPQKIFSQNDSVAGFILSLMEAKNCNLEKATYDAQWEKIAPGNPNFHLHGIVTRNRLALQIMETFGCLVPWEKIPTYGVGSLSIDDVKIARTLGCSIRLLGLAEKTDTGIKASVEPCMIPVKYFLAQARGGSEIVYVQNEDGQSQVYACPGTSHESIVRGILTDLEEPMQKTGSVNISDTLEKFSDRYYIRLNLINLSDTLSMVLQIFAQSAINIESIIQPEGEVSRETENKVSLPLVLITAPTEIEKLQSVLEEIKDKVKLASVSSFFRYIR
jgi:homoserine dehydrogenase